MSSSLKGYWRSFLLASATAVQLLQRLVTGQDLDLPKMPQNAAGPCWDASVSQHNEATDPKDQKAVLMHKEWTFLAPFQSAKLC